VNGRLGAIYIGSKQVGGFIDWYVKMNLADGVQGDDRTHKLQSWSIRTWGHWLIRLLEPGTKVRLKLCADAGMAYWEADGAVASPSTKSLNMLVHAPLDFIGNGELKAKVQDE